MRRRRAAAAIVVSGICVAVGITAVPSEQVAAWIHAGVATAAALTVLVTAPRRTRSGGPWGLIGLGLLVWAAGTLAAAQSWGDDFASAPNPNATDVPRLVGFVILASGLVLMAHARTGSANWISRIDALIVGVGVGAAVVSITAGTLSEREQSGEARALTAIALAVFVGVVASIVRLAFTRAVRAPAGRFLLLGVALHVGGASLLRASQLELGATWLVRGGLALGVAGVALLAAAALHPTAARLAELEHQPAHALSRGRLGLLVLSAVAAPVLAVGQQLRDRPVNGAVLGGGAVLLIALLAGRLQLVVRSGQSQAHQAVTLRDAALAISTARTVGTMRTAVLDTIATLAGDHLQYAVWFVANDRGTLLPLEIRGPDGELRREEVRLAELLEGLGELEPGSLVRVADAAGTEAIVVPITTRVDDAAALALATSGRAPEELAESLAILGVQCGMALDSLVQSQELNHKRGEARFQQLVRHSSDAVVIVGADGRIRYQTPSVVRVLGYLTVDLDGASIRRIVHPEDAAHVERFVDSLVQAPGEAARSMEAQLVRADDSLIHSEIVGLNLLDNLDVRGVVLTIRDVSGRRVLEDQLRHQAFHDPLTGLSNRALFSDRVEHALHRVRRDDSPTPAVLFVDLDDFKMVNDSMGHGAGDALLMVVADRLRGCLRSGDTPARLGGDEFAILLEDAPDLEAVLEVAERVLDSLHLPTRIEDREIYVRASIGVATRRDAEMTPEELLRNADLAMYAAKANGKGCIEVFEPSMHRRAVDRLAIRGDLERAVERGEIDVELQPIVRIVDGEVVAFEALARWEHPTRGRVSPAEFLPVAEDTGVIVPLGRQVLRLAVERVAGWRAENPGAEWAVCVNLSSREVLAPDLVEEVRAALVASDLPPIALILELTETGLLADTDRVLTRLHLLKELGVRIAIDNFGTGYSSLSYLQRVPFDFVKVDRALVSSLRTQEPSTTLVRTIVDLARTLGRQVVAQGVEESVELAGLVELGCDLAQGFLFHRPADAQTLADELGLYPASA